jgi:hypothetical protein
MPFSIVDFVRTHRAASVRIAGLVIFLVAFALPAVRVGKHSDRFSPTFAGYECARIASTGIYELARWPAVPHNDDNLNFSFNDTLLLALSGLINPLVIAQFLSFAQKRRWVGNTLGALTVACMLATWLLFAHLHITPLVGHVLWIVGAGTCVAANALHDDQNAFV